MGGVGGSVDFRGLKIAPPADGRMELARGQRVLLKIICCQGVGLNGKVTFPLDLVSYFRGKGLFASIRN